MDVSNRLMLCSSYQQILPSAVQQDPVGALCLIAMFSSCFCHFSDMIYTQLHDYTPKWMICHDSIAVYELRNTVSALSLHPPILGFLIGPSSISGHASWNCVALLVLAICIHPFISLPAIYQFPCNSLGFLICLYNMLSTFLFYYFPSSPSFPCPFLIFLISLFVLFHLQNMFLVSFLILPLEYLISIKKPV